MSAVPGKDCVRKRKEGKISKFKIGDKVIGNKIANEKYRVTREGWTGKVVEVINDQTIRVVGSSLFGESGDYWVLSDCFDLYEWEKQKKIVITTDGKTTSAKLYEDNKFVKEGIAKCNPIDEFDLLVGAKLAVERLHEPEKQTIPELKDGYLLEIDHEGERSFVKVYHNDEDKLCVSGETHWWDIDRFNKYGEYLGSVITKIYGRTNNCCSHNMSKIDRNLIWERK